MLRETKSAAGLSLLTLAVFAAGCSHKIKPLPPPPPTANTTTSNAGGSGKPAIEFTAEPATVDRGQSAVLRWNVTGANYISIDIFGAVQATGSRSVTPYATTTYHLIADGAQGRSTADATVTVNPGNPSPPNNGGANNAANANLSLDQRISQQVQDVFFAYDQYNIEADAQGTLTHDAQAIKSILTDFPSASLIIEGHCDERGSAEYNLGLGDRRATSAKEFLVQLGVPADKLRTVSYGKERPACTEATEDCYARNRRAHIAPAQ
jgi:peptidoglycan-associated lipoprotein